MIKVTGFKFTPIHQFRPEINKYSKNGGVIVENRFITEKIPFKQNWHNKLNKNQSETSTDLSSIPNPTDTFPIQPNLSLPPD